MSEIDSEKSTTRELLRDERARATALTRELVKQCDEEMGYLAHQLAVILNRLDELKVSVEVNGELLCYDDFTPDDGDPVVELGWRVGKSTGWRSIVKRDNKRWQVR